jgi:UDP-N-acetyl-D-mannosaminuronate dehydrogenase
MELVLDQRRALGGRRNDPLLVFGLSFKKNFIDPRLATILQIRTVLAAQMFELHQLRRRVRASAIDAAFRQTRRQ